MAGQLPWAQQLGTPDPHHPQRGTGVQAPNTTWPPPPAPTPTSTPKRASCLTDHYRSATQRSTHHDCDQHRDRNRDTGLEL